MPLYLVRHGQTDWNLAKRFQSRSDIPLNQTGREQARGVRARLRASGAQFALAKTSPLIRAVETAEIIVAGTGLAPETDEALLEISLGDFEGEHEAALKRRMGDDFDQWRALHFTKSAPGGETLYEAMDRIRPSLATIQALGADNNVLIVGHQGINMAIMAALSGCHNLANLADFRQRNDQVEVWDLDRGERIERFDVG